MNIYFVYLEQINIFPILDFDSTGCDFRIKITELNFI